MADLRVGLIGCGPRSGDHMVAVDTAEGLCMAAAADPSPESRERFKKRYQLPVYDDAAQMLAKEKPDIVVIATREKPRHALTVAALDAGAKAIVLEKPMARNIDEARDMVARAEKKGVPMVVSHQMRFCDEFLAQRDAMARGDIGRSYFLRTTCYGNLMEQGPHMIDMLLFLLGDPGVEWIVAGAGEIPAGRTAYHPSPDIAVGCIQFAGGVRAEFECGRPYNPVLGMEKETWLTKRVEVLGTEGRLDAVVQHYCKLMNARSNGWKTLFEGPQGWDNATIKFYQELQQVMTKGGVHRNNARASLKGFEIIHAAFQSMVSHARVELPLPAGADPLATLLA